MDDQIDELVKRLHESHQLDTLNFNYRNLREFPSIPNKFTDKLKYLHLDNNKLVFAPEVGRFSQLKELSIEENGLSLIPETYYNLKNLRCLNLNKNDLKCLSREFFQSFQYLTILWLNNCGLLYLPNEIENLKFLETLGAKSNSLQELPENFGALINLKWLNLEENQLDSLPKSFSNLKYLHVLNLGSNKLDKLPQLIYEKNQLTTLLIHKNLIKSINDEDVLCLSSLQRVDLSANTFLKTLKDKNFEFYNQLATLRYFRTEK
jgi:Leucine-rich repeat (LRR) protein